MLESITITGAPCFGAEPVTIGPFSPVTFVFGANGSGKTTVSRSIREVSRAESADAVWQSDSQLEPRVYNRDYVRETFSKATPDLAGVFLLGAESVEAHREIEALEAQEDELNVARTPWIATLSGKEQALAQAESTLSDSAWTKRTAVPPELSAMFVGFKNSKAASLAKVNEIAARLSDENPEETYQDLVEEAASVFDEDASAEAALAQVSPQTLTGLPDAHLLQTQVVGSSGVDLASLIEKLGNSDWIHAGREYLDHTAGTCPFCQQTLPNDLGAKLDELFDERYAAQISGLERLAETHKSLVESILRQTKELQASSSRIPRDVLESACLAVNAVLAQNTSLIQEKLRTPSRSVTLNDPSPAIKNLNSLISETNIAIAAHNARVQNRSREKIQLIGRCWQTFVRQTLASDLAKFKASSVQLNPAIENLREKIRTADEKLLEIRDSLQKLRSSISSSASAIPIINNYLRSVGFTSFKLESSRTVKDGYVLTRNTGEHADVDSLSEGERTFITFLFFCQSLEGVANAGPGKLLAVVDDPISSLDSDITFVVSALVRRLIDCVHTETGQVRQLILLTHNAHFYQEVTYIRHGQSTKQRSHFLIRKRLDAPSTVDGPLESSPVRTMYRSLWSEVARARREPESPPVGLQNLMRRIIENYFVLLGGINFDETILAFSGDHQAICRALFAWANDGSHLIFEQLDHSPSAVSTETYLDVFREIFERNNHLGHYEMMMKAADPSYNITELSTAQAGSGADAA